MKLLLTFLFLGLYVNSFGQQAGTKHVITHKRATITTDPSRGTNSYPAWGVFPGKDVPVRKIIMHVTLGTPDSLSTAHWDYCDHIRILNAVGKTAKHLIMKLAECLHPTAASTVKDGILHGVLM